MTLPLYYQILCTMGKDVRAERGVRTSLHHSLASPTPMSPTFHGDTVQINN